MQGQRARSFSGQELLHPCIHPLIEQLIQQRIAHGVVQPGSLPLIEPQDQPDVFEEKWRPKLPGFAGAQLVHHSGMGLIERHRADAALAVAFGAL